MHRTRSAHSSRTAVAVSLALLIAACGGGDSTTGDSTPEAAVATDGEAGTSEPPAVTEPPATEAPAATEAPVVSEGQIEADVVVDESTPTEGGTLRYAIEADVDGLNPTTSALSAPGLTMGNAVFDTLAAFDTDGNAVPWLAESFEPVDGDLSRWRVVVRDGVMFHDGTTLDASAVQANFDAQLASPLVGLALRPFFPAEGATSVIDERTIEFAMLEPNATFPALLTSQLGMVASPQWLAAAGDDPTLNQRPVGTGPFAFDSRSQDSVTRFVRNDIWWGGDVYLDAVEFLPVTDPATRTDLLVRGEVDALHTTSPADVADLRDDDSIQNVIDETGEEQFLLLNTAVPPFDDIRARQALALATPLQVYRDLIGLGVARGADQMFIPESVFYNPAVAQVGDDPAAAAALAAEYCADNPDNCSNGKIDVQHQYVGGSVLTTREADILTEGWGGAFNVDREELLQDEHIQQVVFGQYQSAIFRQFGNLDPSANRHLLMCRTVGEGLSLNFPRYCSEARDALILDAQASTDPAARAAGWQAVSQEIAESFTYIFLLHTIWDNAFGESVRGVCDRTSPDGVPLACVVNGRNWFDSVWIDG